MQLKALKGASFLHWVWNICQFNRDWPAQQVNCPGLCDWALGFSLCSLAKPDDSLNTLLKQGNKKKQGPVP
jgi:hypothetical protein